MKTLKRGATDLGHRQCIMVDFETARGCLEARAKYGVESWGSLERASAKFFWKACGMDGAAQPEQANRTPTTHDSGRGDSPRVISNE